RRHGHPQGARRHAASSPGRRAGARARPPSRRARMGQLARVLVFAAGPIAQSSDAHRLLVVRAHLRRHLHHRRAAAAADHRRRAHHHLDVAGVRRVRPGDADDHRRPVRPGVGAAGVAGLLAHPGPAAVAGAAQRVPCRPDRRRAGLRACADRGVRGLAASRHGRRAHPRRPTGASAQHAPRAGRADQEARRLPEEEPMMLRRRRRRDTGWEHLRENHRDAAEMLDRLVTDAAMSDVDQARILTALDQRRDDPAATAELADEIVRYGPATILHHSSLRDLPGSRLAVHNLQRGQVRLGRTVQDPHADTTVATDFGVDHDVLRTSLLVIGPPGSGKTHGFARPIVENLSLSALAQQASIVVVDPKGDDFAYDGWFDVTIDPLAPTSGFDLYGGTDHPDTAADRLASAMLPPQVSDDMAYFMDGSRNALYACLAPFHLAFGRWPKVREMLALLRSEQGMTDQVKAALRGPEGKEAKALLDTRREQATRNADPAASLIERFQLLARP